MIVERPEYFGLPFVDVGIGVNATDNSLGSMLQDHDQHAEATRPRPK
jgi:hypothetical protein